MIVKRNPQATGKGDAQLALNKSVAKKHGIECIGVEAEQGEVVHSSNVEAVVAVG